RRELVARRRPRHGAPRHRAIAGGDRAAGSAEAPRPAGAGVTAMARALDGVRRSLRLYYRDPARAAAMDRLYRQFVPGGAPAFDIGAHVGDRVPGFRRPGARVVALEPQPALHRTLRLLHGRDAGVTLLSAAVGRAPGRATMHINTAN